MSQDIKVMSPLSIYLLVCPELALVFKIYKLQKRTISASISTEQYNSYISYVIGHE